MTDSTDKLKAAATRAGIINADDLAMVDTTNVADPKAFIAELKKAKPYLFAKSAREMSKAEFKSAKQAAVRADLNKALEPRKSVVDNVRELSASAYERLKGTLGLRHRGSR